MQEDEDDEEMNKGEEEDGEEDEEEFEDEVMSEEIGSEAEDEEDEEDEEGDEEWHGFGDESDSEEVPTLIQVDGTEAAEPSHPASPPSAGTLRYRVPVHSAVLIPAFSIKICSPSPSQTCRGRERTVVRSAAEAHATIERSP